MKKLFTLLAALCVVGAASAQKLPNKPGVHKMATRILTQPKTGLEDIIGHIGVPPHVSVIRNQEVEIGKTHYDLQANGSDNGRLTNLGNGNFVGTWTTSSATATLGLNGPSRGTGANFGVGGTWGASAPAGTRIETVRTGFGSHCVVGDPAGNSTAFNVSHIGVTATNYQLVTVAQPLVNGVPTGAPVQAQIPSTSPNGQLWSRVAAGEGNTIHVIALSTPAAFSGTAINGVDGVPFYYRSQDGGQTWDKTDFIIPGMTDTTHYKRFIAESYHIDADGKNVAVLCASSWGDVVVWKSEDNGDTWTKMVVYDFPIDGYLYDDGILDPGIVDTLDPNLPVTTDGRDTLSVWSSDDHGSVHIDALGKVHVAYGGVYVRDDIQGDGSYNWYPSTGGLVYWNEDDGVDAVKKDGIIPGNLVAFVLDYDGDGALAFTNDQYNGYGGTSMSSKPTMGFDWDNETIYLAYQAPDERFINADKDQVYSHVHILTSKDGGTTWNGPRLASSRTRSPTPTSPTRRSSSSWSKRSRISLKTARTAFTWSISKTSRPARQSPTQRRSILKT